MEKVKSIRLNVSNLSGRRKLALIICLLVFGFGVSEPEFLDQTEVSVSIGDDTGESLNSFDDIEAMLARFDDSRAPQPVGETAAALATISADSEQPVAELSIPQVTASATPIGSLRQVSYPDHGLTIPHTESSTSELNHVITEKPERVQGRATENADSSPGKIRLTGSIFPSP